MSNLCALKNFSRTDRLLRHRRLCQGRGVAKVENQPCCEPRPYPQEPPPAPQTWSPLHPPPGRLAVWHSTFRTSTTPPRRDKPQGFFFSALYWVTPRSSTDWSCSSSLGITNDRGTFVFFVLLTFYCFFYLPVFLKTRLFCDEQWSCFVLNLFDFWNKKKKGFYCSNISAFGGTRERLWVLFILMC